MLPATEETLRQALEVQQWARTQTDLPIPLMHTLHGGTYTRTARLPAGSVITSVLVQIATTVIAYGDFSVLGPNYEWQRYSGFQVFPASANRRQVYAAHSDTTIVMIFPTEATTVAEAEAEFTSEVHLLQSSGGANDTTIITGEPKCQE